MLHKLLIYVPQMALTLTLVLIGHLHFLVTYKYVRSSLTNEKDHHYFLNRLVCFREFFDG